MMNEALEALDIIAQKAKEVEAVKVNPQDAEAYNTKEIHFLWDNYTPKQVRTITRSDVMDISSSDALGRFKIISRANLDFILAQTRATVEQAIASHGEEAVKAVIEEARKACRFSNVALTHDPSHDTSTYADEGNMEKILKDKALKAPHYLGKYGNGDTLISLGIADNNLPPDPRGTYFRIDKLSGGLVNRSLGKIKCYKDKTNSGTIAIGGQHLQAAWTLATIHEALCRLKDIPDAEAVRHFAFETFSELKVPRQLSLTGHTLVRDGVIETITPPRAQPRPVPQEKSLKPDPENSHLHKKARNRGKAGTEE